MKTTKKLPNPDPREIPIMNYRFKPVSLPKERYTVCQNCRRRHYVMRGHKCVTLPENFIAEFEALTGKSFNHVASGNRQAWIVVLRSIAIQMLKARGMTKVEIAIALGYHHSSILHLMTVVHPRLVRESPLYATWLAREHIECE